MIIAKNKELGRARRGGGTKAQGHKGTEAHSPAKRGRDILASGNARGQPLLEKSGGCAALRSFSEVRVGLGQQTGDYILGFYALCFCVKVQDKPVLEDGQGHGFNILNGGSCATIKGGVGFGA